MTDKPPEFTEDQKKWLRHTFRNQLTAMGGMALRLEKILNQTLNHQDGTQQKITAAAKIIGLDPNWALAVAKTESNFGKYQRSPTGARGVFQMTTIAMRDLWLDMVKKDDDWIDILCGCLFLRLLEKRHGSKEKATEKYCAPKDRSWYVPATMLLREAYEKGQTPK